MRCRAASLSRPKRKSMIFSWTVQAEFPSMPQIPNEDRPMHLIQYFDDKGNRAVGVTRDGQTRRVAGVGSVYELAQAAMTGIGGLAGAIEARGLGEAVDKAALVAEGRLLAPIDHPDPAHLLVTGTGLTHLGSAATRDAMHKDGDKPAADMTDSMKMFRMGLENGKPAPGEQGV